MRWNRLLIGLLLMGSALTANMESYQKGVAATSSRERAAAINKVLAGLLVQEESVRSGELDYNIGNCFFLLREYPMAIAYYKKAQRLLPRNRQLTENLGQAEQALGLLPGEGRGLPVTAGEFRSMAVAGVILTTLLWLARRRMGSLFVSVVVLFLVAAGMQGPTSSATVLSEASLRIGAGKGYASTTRLRPGTSLEVVEKGPEWTQVKTSSGVAGFLPSSALLVD